MSLAKCQVMSPKVNKKCKPWKLGNQIGHKKHGRKGLEKEKDDRSEGKQC